SGGLVHAATLMPCSTADSYRVAGLQGCSALRKAFFSNGSAAHPWVVEAPHRRGLALYKGMRKFLCEKIHRALPIMSDRATFGLDRQREAELSIVLFSGKFITCPQRLKSKFGLKSRISCSSTLLVTRSFRLTS